MKKQTKGERLQIRVTTTLKDKLTSKAEQKGLSVSTLVLNYIAKGLEQDSMTDEAIKQLTQNLSKPENLAKLMEGLQTQLFDPKTV